MLALILVYLRFFKNCLRFQIILASWDSDNILIAFSYFLRQKSISADDFVVFAEMVYFAFRLHCICTTLPIYLLVFIAKVATTSWLPTGIAHKSPLPAQRKRKCNAQPSIVTEIPFSCLIYDKMSCKKYE